MPSKFLKPQFVPDNRTTNNSNSIKKFVVKALQKPDSKECEHSELKCPIKHINCIKSIINTTTPN